MLYSCKGWVVVREDNVLIDSYLCGYPHIHPDRLLRFVVRYIGK